MQTVTFRKMFFGGSGSTYFLDFAANGIYEIAYIITTTKMGSSRHGIQTRGRWVRRGNATSVLCSPHPKNCY